MKNDESLCIRRYILLRGYKIPRLIKKIKYNEGVKYVKGYGLKEQTVFITGAGQGIGRSVANVFASHGCNVVVTDIDEEKAIKVANEVSSFGIKSLPLKCDVSDEKDVEESVKVAVEKFSRINTLVACAGIVSAIDLVDSTFEFDRVMKVNAYGMHYCIKHVAKHMIEKSIKGSIICMSSRAGKLGEAHNGPYSCSKAVVNMLTQCYGLELAPYGISVKAVCPGLVDTPMQREVAETRSVLLNVTPEEFKANRLKGIPMGRVADPNEIGEFCAFLASKNAEYITGVAITIAGGTTTI